MGYGNWTSQDWNSFASSSIKSKATVSGSNGIYSSTSMIDDFDPKKIVQRECCDSAEHPNTTPIIIALDVTGSMAPVLSNVAKKLSVLVTEILNRKPVEDPSIMFMGVGDADYDMYPLQVTQFESDIRIAEQLTKIYFEKNGGGNGQESYTMPWFFAKNYVKADAFNKGKKGFLFTLGDECCPDKITPKQLKKIFGIDTEDEIPSEELLNAIAENWVVYHLVIEEGNFYSGRFRNHNGPERIEESWAPLLGQNLIYVDKCENIPEIIVSILEAESGKDSKEIIESWDGSTAMSVSHAIKNLSKKANEGGGLVTF